MWRNVWYFCIKMHRRMNWNFIFHIRKKECLFWNLCVAAAGLCFILWKEVSIFTDMDICCLFDQYYNFKFCICIWNIYSSAVTWNNALYRRSPIPWCLELFLSVRKRPFCWWMGFTLDLWFHSWNIRYLSTSLLGKYVCWFYPEFFVLPR